MKKYLILLLICGCSSLTHAYATDTNKKPPLPLAGLDLDEPAVDNSKIFTLVEVMPKYPGGIDSLYGYLARHIAYPPTALNAQTGGNVTLNFVVEKDGRLSDIRVLSTPNERLSVEAIRVVSTLKLIPGRQNGQPVRVMADIHIRFDPSNPHKFY